MPGTNPLATLFLILLTILFPPLTVFILSGFSVDLIINICLTVLGYLPGHLHGFYLLYTTYHKRHVAGANEGPAPGIYSENVQSGQGQYGTV